MRIINIVDSVDIVNYGIWHAAIVNAGLLAQKGIQTELWYPAKSFDSPIDITPVALASLTTSTLQKTIIDQKLDPLQDIIITHGSWKYPTRWGAWLKQKGFNWIYVPQGMLEPWSLKQKWIKKQLYFYLLEKRMARKADCVRAVSQPENENLKFFFDPLKIKFIPNGVSVNHSEPDFNSKKTPLRYLFLSRLHYKKNVVSLVAAWLQSRLNNNKAYELLIAGPDQGELEKLLPLIQQSDNIQYIGSVYGQRKQELLQQCAFYVLPSFSEGLPSSLLEAMSFGLIPIATEGCNLPDIFTKNLGVKVTTGKDHITGMLEQTSVWNIDMIADTGLRCREFVRKHYSLEAITEMQVDIFSKMWND